MWEVLIESFKVTLAVWLGFSPVLLLAWWIGSRGRKEMEEKRRRERKKRDLEEAFGSWVDD